MASAAPPWVDDASTRIVLASAVLVPVVLWTDAPNAFQLPKATVLTLAAAALLVLGAVRAVSTGNVVLPRHPAAIAAGTLVVGACVSTLVSDEPIIGVLGAYGRYAGLIGYASLAVIAWAVVRRFDATGVQRLTRAVLLGLGISAGYGLAQMLGVDPVEYRGRGSDDIISTLGNSNLVAAAMAIGAPLAATEAILATSSRARIGWSALTVLFVVVLVGSGALQGPVALVGAGAVLALALILRLDGRSRRRGLRAWWIATATGLVTAVLGLFEVGPLGFIGRQSTLTTRRYDWEAALAMFAAEPVTGVGLGRFGTGYRIHRSAEAAVERPLLSLADTAHDVPLNLLAEGGVLVGVPYLAFVGAVGWALARGLRTLHGPRLVQLGGLGAAWTAYQVQSLVSFDVPALALLHWILAGAILVVAGPPGELRIALPLGAPAGTGAKARSVARRRTRTASVVGGVMLLIVAVPITRPLRADLAAGAATESRTIDAALAQISDARALAPWEPSYPMLEARIHQQAGDLGAALAAFADAADEDPSALDAPLSAARLATQDDATAVARERYDDALRAEPLAPLLKAEIGEFELLHGDPERAVTLLEEAVARDPRQADWWIVLGSARREVGDRSGARAALERALELEPGSELAAERLRALG